ncbi:hypothetical protein AURDEDRAFT_39768, partial [Auricularia subglabra TFB-10046 SS5]
LIFSLSVDWFTAHAHHGAGGKKWSIGAIYLVCMNLPPKLRFLPENICVVGIIPGPTKPVGTAIDRFMDIIVDELHMLYHDGVFLTRTAKHSTGRLVRGALGPVIADLDAIRALIGMGAHSAQKFCSHCWLTKTELQSDAWGSYPDKLRTLQEHIRLISGYLSAAKTSFKAARDYFNNISVRHCPLSRLSYWNPFQWAAIDPMHNTLIGLIQRHLRKVFGMNFAVTGWNSETVISGMTHHDQTALGEQASRMTAKEPANSSAIILGETILAEVHADIRSTTSPTWFKKASCDIGKKAHGTMSADELRSAGLVHIPLTLIRLWGKSNDRSQEWARLINYMHLVEAVDLILRRSTSVARQTTILCRLSSYMTGLKKLFPCTTIVPNQHLCFHIPPMLASLGPAWVFSAWVTERNNQLLEKTPTNNHIGALTGTLTNGVSH